jgi:hypothetical protein
VAPGKASQNGSTLLVLLIKQRLVTMSSRNFAPDVELVVGVPGPILVVQVCSTGSDPEKLLRSKEMIPPTLCFQSPIHVYLSEVREG